MDGCLTKPISSRDLRAALSGALDTLAAKPTIASGGLDADRLADLKDALGGTGILRMITRYRSDFADLPSRLNDACRTLDAKHLLALRHEGAGASAIVGATALHTRFARAESLCRAGDVQEAVAIVTVEIPALWVDAEAALAAYQLPLAKTDGSAQPSA